MTTRFIGLVLAMVLAGCAGNRDKTDRPPAGPDAYAAWVKTPDDPDAALGYAAVLRRSGAAAEAVTVLEQALARHPVHRRLIVTIAAALIESGRPEDALGRLDRHRAMLAGEWRFYNVRGVALDRLQRHVDAQSAYGAALTLNAAQPQVLNNFAMSLVLSGHLEEAEGRLRAALAMADRQRLTASNLALVLALKGDLNAAREIAAAHLAPHAVESFTKALEAIASEKDRGEPVPGARLRFRPIGSDPLSP